MNEILTRFGSRGHRGKHPSARHRSFAPPPSGCAQIHNFTHVRELTGIAAFGTCLASLRGRHTTGWHDDERLCMGHDRGRALALCRARARPLLRRDHWGAHRRCWRCFDLRVSPPASGHTDTEPAGRHGGALADPRIDPRPAWDIRLRGAPGAGRAKASATVTGVRCSRYPRRRAVGLNFVPHADFAAASGHVDALPISNVATGSLANRSGCRSPAGARVAVRRGRGAWGRAAP